MDTVVFVLAAILVIYVLRRFLRREDQTLRDMGPRPSPWHAVSIECGTEPCVSALNLRRRRFLSEEAPPLPLPHCDGRRCHCSYKHHMDRRRTDRRAYAGMAARHWGHDGREDRRATGADRRRPMLVS
ncbi:hypothetical protein [Niveibacterium sp. SC-1]|uniref:hypothetical protein n=1 Tax=Niveibacterium sp. SC-1 TaxID=3135646 RepID=UPI00311D8988